MEAMYDYWPYYNNNNSNNYYYPTTPFHNPNRPVPVPSPSRRPMQSAMTDGLPASRRHMPRQVNLRPTRSDYAVKIQKAFRGFRIRKNVSKIVELKRGVDEVERDLMDGETVALIIRDDRHRLKVSETLMALLLKLDSIRGLNDAVRVCRKSVIRKAILLQERIDSLAAEADSSIIEEKDKSERLISEIDENGFSEVQIEKDNDNESEEVAWECVDDNESQDTKQQQQGQGWLVVDDNTKLMEMIAQLCNKNENQTRLIQSLSNRVDQLEQAINDRIIRKKDKKKTKQMMMLNTLSYS